MEEEKDLAISLPLQISDLAKGLVFAGTAVLCFFVPFTLGHPQWLVGAVVNTCLFLGAVYLPKRYYIPLAILPSLGVLSRGLLFGPLTMFLVYFLPFIWLGNLALILLFKFVYANTSKNFIVSVLGSAGGKFALLFVMANVYLKLSVVPAIFLQAMGLNQLATALAGGLLAFIIFYLWRTYQQKQVNS